MHTVRKTITARIRGSTDGEFLCGCSAFPCLCAGIVKSLDVNDAEEAAAAMVDRSSGFFHDDVCPSGKAVKLEPEVDFGFVEYKWKLVAPTESRLRHLVTQLKFRLAEGGGEAIYEVGVTDDGVPVGLDEAELEETLSTLEIMAGELQADMTILRTREGTAGAVAEVLIRKLANEEFTELRVVTLGNVDAGKSTLLGVLAHGGRDNGRGLARLNVFRHPHEVESGRTSAIAQEILGFDSKGKIVNYPEEGELGSGLLSSHDIASWQEICANASKVITLVDLAGHEKHLRTTLSGLTGKSPDFVMMTVGANAGLIGMAQEHFGVALALSVPTFVVVTKTDMTPKKVKKANIKALAKYIRGPGVSKIPVLAKTEDDVVVAARNLLSGRIVPIFEVSSVTGAGLDLLKTFLNLLPHQTDWSEFVDAPVEFSIEERFRVTGVGTVVAGVLRSGTICAGDTLLLGPDGGGNFTPASVKSIHINRASAKAVSAGMTVSLALKKIKPAAISKGMLLLDPSLEPSAHWEFAASITAFSSKYPIRVGHEAVVHTGTTRATARVVALTTHDGDDAESRAVFRFLYNPHFLKPGQRLVFREGRVKGVGIITDLSPSDSPDGAAHLGADENHGGNDVAGEDRPVADDCHRPSI